MIVLTISDPGKLKQLHLEGVYEKEGCCLLPRPTESDIALLFRGIPFSRRLAQP